MSDLISRKALITELIPYYWNVIDIVNQQPIIEAIPEVHGEWKSGQGTLFPVYRCSKCSWANALGQTKFCPNCGADMRKKV